ncbi:MAG: folate-binding protein [Gammaproteobacteria bacterium]
MKNDWKTFLTDAGAEFAADKVAHYGNPEQEQEVALSGLVFSDLGHLAVIAVHGADAQPFLQSQLSNDISQITDTRTQLDAYCTPKGRMLGLMRGFKQGGTYYLRLPQDTAEAVMQRLRMYVMRADVTLEDVTDNFVRIGISGEQAGEELGTALAAVPAEVDQVTHSADVTLLRVPGVQPRFEAYISARDAACKLWDSLNVRGAPVGESAWRLLDILAGLPTIFAATSELFVPQMANLQLVNGVSFKKGCYPGQEIVARMQYLGTLKRRMFLGRIETDERVSPGDALFTALASDQAAGRIVDAQPHPDGGQAALAIIQITAAQSADLHLGNAGGPAFTLAPLPYPYED